MKIWLLSHLKDSPGNRLTLEAAGRRGHEIKLVDPVRVTLTVSSPPTLHNVLGDNISDSLPDVVFTRMGSSAPPETLHVLRQLELMNILCINTVAALQQSRDKIAAFQILARNELPVPVTALVGRDADLAHAVENVPGPPWIVKIPVSTQGSGVVLAESERSLRSICDAFHGVGQRVLVQAFVAEAAGSDIRVLVVGGRARAAMRRQGQKGEFRSNIHRGGRAEEVKLTAKLSNLAEDAAGALGLEVAGVDLLESELGPVIIEVNGSPGLEGLSAATGRDLADDVVRYLEIRHEARRSKQGR